MNAYQEDGQKIGFEATFFPVQDEREAILKASPQDLAKMIVENPQGYLHELWRTDRMATMHDAIKEIPKDGQKEVVGSLPQDLATAFSLMYFRHHIPFEVCTAYVGETAAVVFKAVTGVEYNDKPNEKMQGHLDRFVANVFDRVNTFVALEMVK